MVVGDTYYSLRQKLRSLGGKWCKLLNGWVFSETKLAAIKAAMEEAGVAIESVAAGTFEQEAKEAEAAAAAAVAASSTAAAGAVLTVAHHKKAIVVRG